MHPPQTGRPVEADGRKHDLSHCAVVGLEVAAGEHRKQPDEAADDQRGVLERCARALTGNCDAPMRLGLCVGKTRGVTDVMAPTAKPIVDYTWMKLYNSKSYNACSNMPRFGHQGLLDEKQLAHLMSLLLDPKSPVNQ